MCNESENETARAMIAVLSAEPPAAMVALALQRLTVDPEFARRLAALGCALQAASLDLTAERREYEPAAQAAMALDRWLEERSGDTEAWILALHFAATLLGGEDVNALQIESAAGWIHQFLTKGKTKRPMGGY